MFGSGFGTARGIGGCGARTDAGGTDGREGAADGLGGGDVIGRGATLADGRETGDSPARMREPGGPPTGGRVDGRGAGTDGRGGGTDGIGALPAAGTGFWARDGGG